MFANVDQSSLVDLGGANDVSGRSVREPHKSHEGGRRSLRTAVREQRRDGGIDGSVDCVTRLLKGQMNVAVSRSSASAQVWLLTTKFTLNKLNDFFEGVNIYLGAPEQSYW